MKRPRFSAAPARSSDDGPSTAAKACQRDTNLTWLCVGAATAASALGLVSPNAYAASDATVQMLRGFDLVMLVVVVPGLMTASMLRAPGSDLVRPGLLAYTVYASVIAAVTGGLGEAFLAQVFLLTVASLTLLKTLPGTLAATRPRLRSRGAAVPLGALALSLAAMWTISAVQSAATGRLPEGSLLVESDLTIRLGMMLDLWLLVPLYAVAAFHLWRAGRVGRALGYLAFVSGLVHQVGYTVALVFQARADVTGAHAFDPIEPAIIVLYLGGLLALTRAARRHP